MAGREQSKVPAVLSAERQPACTLDTFAFVRRSGARQPGCL